MQSDGLRGRGVWTGCHSFENIICDGDRINKLRPRNGALRQGGTYWYYYKLDDAEEAYDSAAMTTCACPLLPGQMVNILEIPIEVIEAPQRVCSASANLPTTMEFSMTTNPEDRYKKIYSKPPTKLPRYYCSSDALRERFAADASMSRDLRYRDRLSSRGIRSIKRVRRDEPEYQRPGACQIDVSWDDISVVANMPDLDHTMNELPELRPFAPCPSASPEERPVTRGHGGLFTDFTKGLGFSFFGSLRQPKKNTHRLSQEFALNLDDSPPQLSQYDGAYDEPQFTQWPLSPPLSELADEENWPLPPLNCFRPASSHTPLHGPSTPTSAIPILNLNNQSQSRTKTYHQPISTALSSSATSDDFHPGFGPSKSIPGSFDMASPTFTADTLDSSFSSSLTTPDRLSFNFEPSNHEHQTLSDNNTTDFHTGLEDLSNRLSTLYTDPPSSSHSDLSEHMPTQRKQKPDFLSFLPPRAPLYLQNVQARRSRSSGDYEQKSNDSCLTLRPVKSGAAGRGGADRPFSLCLPVGAGEWDGEDGGFSSDVLGALGMV